MCRFCLTADLNPLLPPVFKSSEALRPTSFAISRVHSVQIVTITRGTSFAGTSTNEKLTTAYK